MALRRFEVDSIECLSGPCTVGFQHELATKCATHSGTCAVGGTEGYGTTKETLYADLGCAMSVLSNAIFCA